MRRSRSRATSACWRPRAVIAMRARVDGRDDLPKLIAHEIDVFEATDTSASPPVRVRLPLSSLHPRVIDDLKNLLVDHPGQSQVFLHLDDKRILRLPDDFSVDAGNGLVAELRVLLGPDAVLV